ncbi:VOC family protein [Shewanella waksmanii]|uniref:VOC family protein n=1 Tax=Shewanella waksmanii TaxID=213783 RepID=UPI0037353455
MKVSSYQPGQPCWVELASNDALSARHFYSALFDWGLKDMPMPEGVYTMFTLGEDDVGAMFQMPEFMAQADTPTHWGIYFAVADVAASAQLVQQHGGSVVMGPHDVGDAGSMVLCQDPEGAHFSIWQAKQHVGCMRKDENSTLCWVELACRDTQKAGEFYTKVFGWQSSVQDMSGFEYTEWHTSAGPQGGMMAMTEEWGDLPAHWMSYFMVENCDASAAKAAELGGKVCVPPTDIANVGRFAVLNDPQGGVFSVITLTTPS